MKPTEAEVDLYLRQLDEALAGVPDETAQEIRVGIAEELFALTPAEAHARIERLGDPVFIAAEARRAEVLPSEPESTNSRVGSGRASAFESRVYIALASLAVAFGMFVVPIVGGLVGYVLVLVSRAWRRWEKVVAISIPVIAGAAATAYFVQLRLSSIEPVGEGADLGESWMSPTVLINVVFAIAVANVFVGLWLLVRALRRN